MPTCGTCGRETSPEEHRAHEEMCWFSQKWATQENLPLPSEQMPHEEDYVYREYPDDAKVPQRIKQVDASGQGECWITAPAPISD